jgi:hypothetical protein
MNVEPGAARLRTRLLTARWIAIGVAFLPGLFLFLPPNEERLVPWLVCLGIVVVAIVIIIAVERRLRTLGWKREGEQ